MKYREEENFRLEWNVPDRFADIVRFGTASVVSSFSFARSLSISLSLSHDREIHFLEEKVFLLR